MTTPESTLGDRLEVRVMLEQLAHVPRNRDDLTYTFNKDEIFNAILALLQSNGDERERLGRVDELRKHISSNQAGGSINNYSTERAIERIAALTKASEAGQEGEVKP